MADTQKPLSERDFGQTLKSSYNQVDASLTVAGFLTGRVGHKVSLAISTTTITNDTETFSYSDNGTALYAIKIIYTSGTRDLMLSAERIS
jgi:hypothetical protein